jgi:hypothetical protein
MTRNVKHGSLVGGRLKEDNLWCVVRTWDTNVQIRHVDSCEPVLMRKPVRTTIRMQFGRVKVAILMGNLGTK